jgi:3-oxoacyl-[acyl-carrier protein] reductase
MIPAMKAQKHGRIITITSLSVLEPIDHLVVSTAMRTAVTAFMKTLSKEVAPFGITANTVLPGVIHTDRIVNLRKAKAERDGSTLAFEMEKTAKTIPMGRLGEPHELASLVAFLASEKASFITGANIPVDGGMRHAWQ